VTTATHIIAALAGACDAAGLRPAHESVSALGPLAGPHDALQLLDALTARVEAELPDDERLARRRTRPLDPEAVRGLREQGLTDREIGERLGTTAEAVRWVRRREGMLRPARSGWEEQLQCMHRRGLSVTEMRSESGWAEQTVRQRLSKLELPAHRVGRWRRTELTSVRYHEGRLPELQWAAMVQSVLGGTSWVWRVHDVHGVQTADGIEGTQAEAEAAADAARER
jgi:hypothetical protein